MPPRTMTTAVALTTGTLLRLAAAAHGQAQEGPAPAVAPASAEPSSEPAPEATGAVHAPAAAAPARPVPETPAAPAVVIPSLLDTAPKALPAATLPPGPARSEPADAQQSRESRWRYPYYDQGFVLVSMQDPETASFRLKLNHVSQFKYTNTLHVDRTFTDHLGNERAVLRRHDIQLTRDVFYFSGFAFDRRLDFNIILYISSATLSATAAGYVGFAFHKAFALRAGFFSLPSLRSMTATYPFFHGTDRSMAVNYMRPGFTQGVWADGELFPGFSYIAMVGNSLNTLDISAVRIDAKFAYAVSLWYDHNEFGRPWNDYERHQKAALRVGTAFTYAREDRLSDLSTASPENNATFISDGVLLFQTGALAPDVTVDLASFWLYAFDAGVKYRGLALNVEFANRWLKNFAADGPLPIGSLFDWGFEASLGYFVFPHRLELYGRSSLVQGRFGTPYEGGGGFNLYPLRTRQVWFNFEAMGIKRSPYGSVLYVYSAGQTGLLLQSQFLLRF